MNWDHASIAASDRGSFTASIDEQWVALKGVHGGIVAALVVEATDAKLADVGVQPDSRLRAATFGYVQPNHVGESTIEVEIVRRGSSMVTTHAQVAHDGGITTVGRLHHSSARSGIEFSDVELLPRSPLRPFGSFRRSRFTSRTSRRTSIRRPLRSATHPAPSGGPGAGHAAPTPSTRRG